VHRPLPKEESEGKRREREEWMSQILFPTTWQPYPPDVTNLLYMILKQKFKVPETEVGIRN